MAIRNSGLDATATDWSSGQALTPADLNDTFTRIATLVNASH